MLRAIIKNKEWIFSGVGVVILSSFIGFFFLSQSNIQSGRDIVININNNITLEQFQRGLEAQKESLKKKLSLAAANEKNILKVELAKIQENLLNLEASYHEEKVLRKESEDMLQQFKDKLPKPKIDAALKALREGGDTIIAEDAFDEVVKNGSGPIAQAAYQSGLLAENRVDYKKAIKQYTISVTLAENNPDYLLSAGKMARTIAHYKQSQIWLERLYKIRQKKGGTVGLAQSQHALADLYKAQGKYEQAEPLYQRSLAITEKALGKHHPSVAETLNNLAMLYYSQGKYEQAEPLYQRSLEILIKRFPQGHPNIEIVKKKLCFIKIKGK